MEGRTEHREDGVTDSEEMGARTEPADPWRAFLEPGDGADFLAGWLSIACGRIEHTSGAVLFLRGDGERLGPVALWKVEPAAVSDFAMMAEALLRQPEPLVNRGEGRSLLGYPIETGGDVQGVLVLALSRHPSGASLRHLMRELHWACGWIEARLMQGQARLGRKQAESARLVTALLAACGEHERFDGAALALVNAIPDLTGFDGAALGMRRGGRVRLEALSRAAAFGRRAERTRAYEAAMDEAVAQAEVVAWPERPDGRRVIDAAHRSLAGDLGAGVLVSAPLSVHGKTVGVLTLEKSRGSEETVRLGADTLDELRLVTAALASLLRAKHDERRLISGRLRHWVGRGGSAILGRRPAISLAAIVLAVALVLPFFVPADLRVRAAATVEGRTQQAAVAPVDGFIAEAPVRAGEEVVSGDVMVQLDNRDLALEAAAAEARTAEARQSLREALAKGDRGAAAVANADLAEARATADLIKARLDRLIIRAPIDGLIVSGDLSQRIGSPVSRGDVLFEIAEQAGWKLRIDVSEYDLALVEPGQTGHAVLSGMSDIPIAFDVLTIASVSDPAEGENRFRVEARITHAPPALRPGLEGVAKIVAGQTTLANAWLRGTRVRLRLLLWRFLP